MMTIDEDVLRAIRDQLAKLGIDFAEHKVASATRNDDVLEKIGRLESIQRTQTDELSRIRNMCGKAIETANDAKRTADDIAHEARTVHQAIIAHTHGIQLRLTQQDHELAAVHAGTDALRAESGRQTEMLNALSKAEMERAIREKASAELIEASAKRNDAIWRKIQIATPVTIAIVSAIVWALSHMKLH